MLDVRPAQSVKVSTDQISYRFEAGHESALSIFGIECVILSLLLTLPSRDLLYNLNRIGHFRIKIGRWRNFHSQQ